MRNSPIVVIDSGIGGLTVLKKLKEKFFCENFIYLCDCKNMPYGNKSSAMVKSYCLGHIRRIKKYEPKAIIIACNTMSLTCSDELKKVNFAPVFLVEPNLSKMLSLGAENCLILCTERSAKSEAIGRLANICSHSVVAFKMLAKQIEGDPFNASEFLSYKLLEKISSKKYIFLGCTHYLYFYEYLRNIYPNKKFFDGTEEIIKNVSKSPIFKMQKKDEGKSGKIKFIGSGSKRAKSIFSAFCNHNHFSK